jgi:hypothetical protein
MPLLAETHTNDAWDGIYYLLAHMNTSGDFALRTSVLEALIRRIYEERRRVPCRWREAKNFLQTLLLQQHCLSPAVFEKTANIMVRSHVCTSVSDFSCIYDLDCCGMELLH